jgi:YidC/Oxa1 family membrane protein insertase
LGDIWGGFVRLLETILTFFYDPRLVGVDFTLPFHNAGVAIILFTIAVRLVMLPLTASQLRSSREMQKLQPKVRELQKKYAKDKEKLNQEMMKLYKEHGVNPASGCLPSLIQLPIFFGVYFAVIELTQALTMATLLGRWIGSVNLGITLPNILDGFSSAGILAHQPFLWMSSMGSPDPWRIMPILAAALQLVQQKMMTPRDADPQQSAMNNAMMFLPIMFLVIGWNFPAGAVLYWVTQSLFGIVQQYFTSGWGSLARWLPFLPERKPRERKARPEGAAAPASAETQPLRERSWFWRFVDRLSSLQEQAKQNEPGAGTEETGADPRATLPPAPEKRRSRK